MKVRQGFSCLVGGLALAANLQGQAQAQPQAQPQPLEIYQIDLDPSGAAFALGKPKLEGDTWVYHQWPEKAIVRLPQATVKNIKRRTKDLSKETVYQIDLVPTGRMIARAEPKLKGGTYVFYSYKDGTFMSLRQSDVQKITRLTGLPAFRVQQEEMGAALIGDLPMQGGTATVIAAPAAAGAPPNQTPAPGNWIYQGKPGVTDAYAPANATVASPGDVPKAPAPAPTKLPS